MAKLEYTLKNDTLFKMLFVRYPHLLKRLVAEILHIKLEEIEQFSIMNPEIPPAALGDKVARLDIHMTVNDKRVDLEVQIRNEGDYPERSLFYWARVYSSALGEGEEYSDLPRTIIVNIIDFKLFDCDEFHSEFQALEVSRHTPLTDRMSLHYFELPKLPKLITKDDKLELWLALFNANTEEDIKKIEEMEVPVMQEAIGAYRKVSTAEEFKELERIRSLARHNEASALGHAMREGERKGAKEERKIWQGVVAKKDSALAEKDAEIARLRAQLENSH